MKTSRGTKHKILDRNYVKLYKAGSGFGVMQHTHNPCAVFRSRKEGKKERMKGERKEGKNEGGRKESRKEGGREVEGKKERTEERMREREEGKEE